MIEHSEAGGIAHQFVSFTLAGEEYGIPILRVPEILRYKSLIQVPWSSEFVDGVVNIRGREIPVVDLRRRWGVPASEDSQSTRIVVVDVDRQVIGLVVDSVTEVRTIDKSQIVPPLPVGPGIDTEFIYGVARLEDRMVVLLDVDRVFNEGEKKIIAEVAR